MKPDESQRKRVLWLTHAALVTWCISLTLPALYFNDSHEAWLGGYVLVLGTLMGWMIHGWAVYANLFFGFAVLVLYGKGKPAISLVFMWLLVATLPAFAHASMAASSGDVPKLQSWGWGFVAWIAAFAIVTLAAAARAGHVEARGIRVAGVAGIAALAAVVGFHGYQWSRANIQERKGLLALGVAFTSREFCGIELGWPEMPVVTPGAVVELDVDRSLKNSSDGTYLYLPELPDYQEDGVHWVTHRSARNLQTIRVRGEPVSAPVVLEARRTEGGAIVRLKDSATGKALYEQRLRKAGYSFCPGSIIGSANRTLTVDAALMRALGIANPPVPVPEPDSLAPDATTERCDLGAEQPKGTRQHLWDGRVVVFNPEPDHRSAGYCSSRYAALVRVEKSWTQGELNAAVYLFDRATLRPMAMFFGKPACEASACGSITANQSRGLRIEGDAAVIDMPGGEMRATRSRLKPDG